MNYLRLIICIAAAVIAAAVFPVSSAADSPAGKDAPCAVFAYEVTKDDRLMLRAYVSNPKDPINAGLLMLKYDTDLLSLNAEDIKEADGIVIPGNLKYNEEERGYVGVDWYPMSTIEPSEELTEVFSAVFDINGDINEIEERSPFTVCDDTEFLDSIGGYGNYGGVLLCTSSMEYFDTSDATVNTYIGYGLPKKNNGTLSIVLISLGCILAAVAAWIMATKRTPKVAQVQ